MSKNRMNWRNQFVELTIENIVSQDYLVRKSETALDFEFIYPSDEEISVVYHLFLGYYFEEKILYSSTSGKIMYTCLEK